MNCRKVNNLLSAYIDSELPGVEQLQVREHLRVCQECSREHDGLLQTKRMLASLRVQRPADELEQRILDSITEEPARKAGARWTSGVNGWWELLAYPQKLRLAGVTAAACVGFAFMTIAQTPRSVDARFGAASASLRAPNDVAVPASAFGPAGFESSHSGSMPVGVLVNYHNPTESVPPRGDARVEPVNLEGSSPLGR